MNSRTVVVVLGGCTDGGAGSPAEPMGSYPELAAEAGAALVGGTLDDDHLDGAARIAAKLAKPLDNTDFTIGWRKDMAPVFVRRALEELRVG